MPAKSRWTHRTFVERRHFTFGVHGQPAELVSVAFSAEPAQLEHCAFMMVAYGSSRGDVGYILTVKDFLDLQEVTR